jgi:hypothetical protein
MIRFRRAIEFDTALAASHFGTFLSVDNGLKQRYWLPSAAAHRRINQSKEATMSRKHTQVQEPAQQELVATGEPGEDGGEHAVEPNPRSWAGNNAAGVEYLTRKAPYQFLIRFKEKPSREVIGHMKDQGFRWDRDGQVWARPVAYKAAAQDAT